MGSPQMGKGGKVYWANNVLYYPESSWHNLTMKELHFNAEILSLPFNGEMLPSEAFLNSCKWLFEADHLLFVYCLCFVPYKMSCFDILLLCVICKGLLISLLQMASVCWLFYISKFIEMLDTVSTITWGDRSVFTTIPKFIENQL